MRMDQLVEDRGSYIRGAEEGYRTDSSATLRKQMKGGGLRGKGADKEKHLNPILISTSRVVYKPCGPFLQAVWSNVFSLSRAHA